MKSINAGTFFGIPIKIHWTFSIVYLGLFGYGVAIGMDTTHLFALALFIIFLFICVILHEYGHALTARKYGVKTLDIIISPIGGVARLQKLPDKPIQELWVAIAGPLVNLFIAIVLVLITLFTFNTESSYVPEESLEFLATPLGFMIFAIYINGILFLFNLIPAFPMDGGRIFRALLSMRYGKVIGTKYASTLGRILAVVFMGLGIYYQKYMITFIGIYVFIMARSENQQVQLKSILSSASSHDILNADFSQHHLSDTMHMVYEKYVRGGEKNYLVYDSLGNVSGVVSELAIKQAFKNNQLEESVNFHMKDNYIVVESNPTLDVLFEKMNQANAVLAIIKNGDQIQGVIDRQSLFSFIQLNLSK